MKALVLYDDSVAADVRAKMPAKELQRRGLNVTVKPYNQALPGDFMIYDTVLFQRPIVDISGPISIAKEAGVRCVVEIDDDFSAIPVGHPGYSVLGQGNVRAMINHEWALQNADLVTTSTPELARRIELKYNRRVIVIPNAWDDTNPLWTGPVTRVARDNRINFGWAGSMTHRDDFALIAKMLLRFARDHSCVRVVIGADLDIYKLFISLPEEQKLFIPGMKYEVYPWIVRNFDVLLAPLEDTYFTQAKSDVKLVEAGAAGIPYIASDVLPYREWWTTCECSTGTLVSPKDERGWYSAFQFYLDWAGHEGNRAAMGNGGRQAAENRRISKIADLWAHALGVDHD